MFSGRRLYVLAPLQLGGSLDPFEQLHQHGVNLFSFHPDQIGSALAPMPRGQVVQEHGAIGHIGEPQPATGKDAAAEGAADVA